VADAHTYLTRVGAQLQAHRQRTITAGITAEIARNRRRNRRVALTKAKRE
jgi:hypothetical protein